MSITKRTFLSIGGLFCLVLLALNAATYLLFRQSITRQLITSQEAVTEANVQLSHVFTQTTDKLIYQYTSDTELGELLSRPVGRDELEDLNTKSLLNSRMTYHLNAENLLTNNGFRMELYLDPALPVSGLFTPENTIPNVSRVFSGDTVADTEWYRTVRGSTQGRYVFLDETRQRLCFAFKLQNSTYAGAHRKAGLGVLLGSLPLAELIRRILVRPFACLGHKLGMKPQSLTAMLVGFVSALPTLSMYQDMDDRGKIAAGAFLVSGTSLLAAHMAFTLSTEPLMLGALIAAKLSGAVAAVLLALFLTRKLNPIST